MKKNSALRSEVRTLIELHTPREIGDRLGISRQRVYQILSDEGIDYLPLTARNRRQRAISRNLTQSLGPAIAYVDRNTRGAISELLTAADLMALGWKLYVPLFRNHGHDLIAVHSSTVITIEVRSALRKQVNSIAARGRTADHFAFVIPNEPIVYKPPLPEITTTNVTIAETPKRGARPQYSEDDIGRAAKAFRDGATYKEAAEMVLNRKGKPITPTQLKRRIDEN